MKWIQATGTFLAEQDLDDCVSALKQGKIVAYPTETFYALGIDPFNQKAVERLYEVKGRPAEKQFPWIAADVAMVRRVCSPQSPFFERLAQRFWPGPLGMVLPLKGAEDSVAIRVSSHPVARQIAYAFGNPIVSTSANRSGEPAINDPNDIRSQLADDIDLLVDCGMTSGGLPSTIVSFPGSTIEILREGSIPSDQVLSFL